MDDEKEQGWLTADDRIVRGRRILMGVAAAVVLAMAGYALATWTNEGVVAFSFLIVLPVAVGALAAFLADPLGRRPRRFYFEVTGWLCAALLVVAAIVLREGAVCIVMLAPLWITLLLAGTLLTRRAHRRIAERKARQRTYCLALLVLPLTLVQVEAAVPLPTERETVGRSIVIDASAEALWPLVQGVGKVAADEGRWNLTQNVIGVPRPVYARLVGQGTGANRYARWSDDINFREVIDTWQPGRHIGWRFAFDGDEGWAFTDRHLRPDSRYMRIERGGYLLEPLGEGRTRLTLYTQYAMTTPVNRYAALWGELFLGDLENNLLAIIAARAAVHPREVRARP